MKGNAMTNLLQNLNIFFQPAIKALERIGSKAHWGLIMLLFAVCFLFSLGSGVYYDMFVLFPDRSLSPQELSDIVVYNIPTAVFEPFAIFVLWIVQYLVIRLFRGNGSFIKHGWVNFVCFTPFIVVVSCLSSLPMNTWVTMLFLVLGIGFFYMCVLNIWMMSVIYGVSLKGAFVSTLLGYIAIPIVLVLIMALCLISGIMELPHPS